MNVDAHPESAAVASDYLCQRVADTLLREDVRECVSRGFLVEGERAPFARFLSPSLREGTWLRAGQWQEGELWLSVMPCHFMQEWRLRTLPAIWRRDDHVEPLYSLSAILAHFRTGLDEEILRHHEAFEAECLVAEEHQAACEAERQHYLAAFRGGTLPDLFPHWPNWAASLLYHDRLAAFHDHPFYPTSRAKLGFSAADLRAYAPEFQPRFALRWLAVPRVLYHGTDPQPELWPSFTQVGLDDELAADHVLLPVHPFLWDHDLERLLAEIGAQRQVIRAPRPWLTVTPTLSVRTMALLSYPQIHLKLPLTMCTLGARNLRTIKPSTITDGAIIQNLLGLVGQQLPEIGPRLLLTHEDAGAHVAEQPFLGFILRRYPMGLDDSTLAPVAALTAPAPDGRTVLEALAEQYYGGDVLGLFQDYMELTLRLHLTLWIRYGIALESNQQNTVVVLSHRAPRLRLLLKDNDAPRIWGYRLETCCLTLASSLKAVRDKRIVTDAELPLAQMFITITLQLNIAVVVEALAEAGKAERRTLYRRVRETVAAVLGELAEAGEDVSLARQALLDDACLPLKYLLRAASLESKAQTGAADVNKFYGKTAPNFLRCP